MGMEPAGMLNSQLFTFLFAFVVFLAGVVLMNIVVAPGLKRMEDLDSNG